MVFGEMPSAGIWADRKETDEEILKDLGDGWRGFAEPEELNLFCSGDAYYGDKKRGQRFYPLPIST